jgi:16S rRNA (cytosine967-C5)-methyltransferase
VNAILRKAAARKAAAENRGGVSNPLEPWLPAADPAPRGAPPAPFCADPSAASLDPSPAAQLNATPDAAYLSVRYSYPMWLAERWTTRYGPDFAAALMDAGNRKPDLTIRVNRLRADPESVAAELCVAGFSARRGRYAEDALILDTPGAFSRSAAFREGRFTVQDEGSMLCALALAPEAGDRILDLCAAPGGKCGYLAELTRDGAEILATDIYPHKLALIEETKTRLGITSIKTALMDAARFDGQFEGTFDKVLLDAPCSGFGVIRKKPEIKWTKTDADVAALAAAQARMLANAARYVRRGGALVYSVCTTEPEEGEAVVRGFLRDNAEFTAEDPRAYLPAALSLPSSDGASPAYPADSASLAGASSAALPRSPLCTAGDGLRLFPHTHGIDGFYIARLRHTGSSGQKPR